MNPDLSPHLSDDDLIARLYGLGDVADDQGHLAACIACGERLRAMGKARLAMMDAPQFSSRRLAVQRQQILERLQTPSSGLHASYWIPAAAVAALLAVATFLHQHSSVPSLAPAAATAANSEGDAELFTDVYSMEQDVEPRAAAPIRALFQETSFEPAASGKEAGN
jgi:hypothetical protein